MTLRAGYVLAGTVTFLPALAFLLLFRPPHQSGGFWWRARHGANVGTWWVGASLRLLAAAVAADGFRVMTTNLLNGNRPIIWAGWFDKLTAILTVALEAGGSVLFFFVYLAFRVWPMEDPEDE